MNTNSYLKQILLALTVVFFASCDTNFNEIGSNIIGSDNFGLEKQSFDVLAFNQNQGAIQTNNLAINSLGIYTNPAFGTTTANFVTQLELASINPTINAALNPQIESVILSIPYFSKNTGLKADGVSTNYTLDSIHGPAAAKIKLSVFESRYYLRDLDQSSQEAQRYYSNQSADFESNLGSLLNTDTNVSQNSEFVFSNEEVVTTSTATDGTVSTVRSVPAMRLNLDVSFFQNKIFGSSASGQLATNNSFKNYFRGLFFKAESSGANPTNQALINFKGGTITINYKENLSLTDATVANRVKKTIVLNLTGNSVNLFQNDYLPSYTNAIATPNTAQGDEKLFLKGGEGSMAILNLFGADANNNGVADQLEELRANKWLINDASLTFYIDQSAMSNTLTKEPNRIYLYDLNNKKVLLDYSFDVSTGTNTKFSKFVFGGILENQTGGRGLRYKIKLTNHIRNLIKNDTVSNVRLGLVVSESINIITNQKLKTPVFSGLVKETPTTAVLNPLGTILFGSNPAVAEDKRLKFEIYYTKPNQ